jgi:thiol peroxidase
MAEISLGGTAVHTSGELPAVGSTAPSYELVGADLSTIDSSGRSGRTVLNIFPSVDTPTCATSVRRFNELVGQLEDTEVICVSADLPFATSRFCGAEGLEHVATGSTFRGSSFASDYGVELVDGPFAGLLARAVVVLDADGTVLHSELVAEIANEPDYDAAIAVLG